MNESKSLRAPLITLALLCCGIYLALPTNTYHVEFKNAYFNHLAAAALVLGLPLSLFWIAGRLLHRGFRVFVGSAAYLMALPCLLFALIAMITAPAAWSSDPSFDQIAEVERGYVAFRLYRTDCGATCSTGLALRREVDLPLGLKVVSNVWGKYKESVAKLEFIGTKLRVTNDSDLLWEGVP